jgi:hypothetical protein
MDLQIYIENQLADISQEFSTLLTFAIDDVRNFGSRETNFSKQIILPGTQTNNRLFGNIWDLNNSIDYNPADRNVLSNFNPSVAAKCQIFKGNIQCFKGVIRVLKINVINDIPEYECVVFGELGGLLAKLGAKKLEDLDFSEYTHTLDAANVTASWDNQGEGYYYPLIDYANQSTNKQDWKLTTFRPCFFLKEYIDKIFEAAGYTYDSDLFQTNLFKSIILSGTRKENAISNVTTALDADVVADVITGYSAVTNSQLGIGNYRRLYMNAPGGAYVEWEQAGTFTLTHNVTVKFKCVNPTGFNLAVRLLLLEDGTSGTTILKTANVTVPARTALSEYTVSLTHSHTATVGNDLRIALRIPANIENPETIAGGTWVITNSPSFQYTIGEGDTINTDDFLPQNILQKDLLAWVAKLMNLYIYEDDSRSNHVNITPYTDFWEIGGGEIPQFLKINDTDYLLLNDSGDKLIIGYGGLSFVDWSDKLDRSRNIAIIPMGELNARFYSFKYKQDSDYYNELYSKKYNQTYGNRLFDSGYEFGKESETVEIGFSSSPLVKYDGDDKYMTAIYKKSNNDTAEDAIEGNLRILYTKKLTCNSWDILKPSDPLVILDTVTEYGYAGHLNDPITPTADLNFGATKEVYYGGVGTSNNMFNVYWSPYMAELTDLDSILVEAYFRLTDADILQLNFAKFIYLQGNLFRLIKIEDWNANEQLSCKVTLLRVIQTEY